MTYMRVVSNLLYIIPTDRSSGFDDRAHEDREEIVWIVAQLAASQANDWDSDSLNAAIEHIHIPDS